MGFIEGFFGLVLFVFNIILGLAGVAFFALGIILAIDFRDYADEDLFEDKYLWGPVAIAITLGIVLVLICIFGICGLCAKKKAALYGYCALLICFLGLEIAMTTIVFTSKDKLQESAEKGIRAAIPAAYTTGSSGNTRKAIDQLQKEFDCCGGFNQTDYTSQNLTIADSCCITESTGCGTSFPLQIHTTGCGKALLDKFDDRGTATIAIAITFVVLQVVAFIFACYKLQTDDSGTYV